MERYSVGLWLHEDTELEALESSRMSSATEVGE